MFHQELPKACWDRRSGSPETFTRFQCCFDEESGEYNTNKPHDHIVIESHYIKWPHSIYDGYCAKTELGWVFGIQRKYLS